MPVLNFNLFDISKDMVDGLFTALCLFIAVFLAIRLSKRSHEVFLVDFACYKPSATQSCSKERTSNLIRCSNNHPEEMIVFARTVIDKAGLSDSTYLPDSLLQIPVNQSFKAARLESQRVMIGAIDELLAKSNVQAQDIGILVVNCSLFNVVPSLSSIIVNHYKLRENISSYSLGGMGCSAGIVSIGLANQLLQVHPNTCALVVSTENISAGYYKGNDRSKFVINCLFRLGGAAILLSNRPSDRESSKYQLMHTVRTHTASSDQSYNCIFQEEDEQGNIGVTINKDLIVSAVQAIKLNLTSLGPLVLPLSEKFIVIKNLIMRRFYTAKIQPYVPKFSKCIHHFFPHVGGKPVLDELQKNLGFSDATMEASRMTLYRFGNTSSSSVWYALAYAEAKGRIKKGDILWQMAFGSGFKCSSVIWRAMRVINYEEANPWNDEIHIYPVNLDNIRPLTEAEFHFEPSK